ncbi:small nuclear RNA activating complex, subunit SNAP43-domain-containing protein [Choanephora cucurbitarum]|nr:small nuclear RNA activating complex, subunit SNAP43-domain-containing protein [Choanephora cucurbitarum]
MSLSSKNRFPSTALEVTNLVRISKTVGIDRHAIEKDVEFLLYQFISQPNQTFSDFDDLWHTLKFSHVHFACVQREFRENYMNAFFSCFLDHFESKIPLVQSAVLFSIYLLYLSQPTVWGKHRIRVTQGLYTALFEFYHQSIMSETNVEAALIFDQLRTREAFLFVAEETLDKDVYQTKQEFVKPIQMNHELESLKKLSMTHHPLQLCSESSLADYRRIADEYQLAKQKTFSTPQAALAAQQKLKETTRVVEKRPRLLQNVFLTTTLAEDETNTMKHIIQSSQQFLNAKRRKLE